MTNNSVLDLSWGSPYFLFPYWNNVYYDVYNPRHFLNSYKYEIGCSDLVINSIKALHYDQANADISNKFVVIGNGATQILRALIYTLSGKVYANPPHFSRFPILTKLSGAKWDKKNYTTLIKTIPNNPDGNHIHEEESNKLENIIYDLSYNWLQYTHPIKFNEDIMVFSLAKATGHASTRIGWLLTPDEDLAEKVRQFVEYDTGGVSREAQTKLLSVINHQIMQDYKVFNYGAEILNKRWDILKNMELPFTIENETGMFLWCKGTMPNDIKGINGKEFGASEKYFRLNLGCSQDNFNEFIRRYRK